MSVLSKVSTGDTDAHAADNFAAFSKIKSRQFERLPLRYHCMTFHTDLRRPSLNVTGDEVEKLISSALNKTCQSDPAPTWLVKDTRELLSPFISLRSSKSLTTGCFPPELTEAVARLLQKKSGLEANGLRPVSNLPFIVRLLEKVVRSVCRLINSNGLTLKMQSAYRRFHSTDTAVTKVFNDLLLAADAGLMSALSLLDLTAAFDTVDYELLLLRLELQFSLRVWSWRGSGRSCPAEHSV